MSETKNVEEVTVEVVNSPEGSSPSEDPLDELDDESSIEALNWSDFDEEEVEAARLSAAREFPNDGPASLMKVSNTEESESTAGEMSESQGSKISEETVVETVDERKDDTEASVMSAGADQEFQSIFEYTEDVEIVEEDEDEDDTEKVEEDVRRELSGSFLSLASLNLKEDSASNAPVLDDGPIWGKGEKLYKFHENRKINQKLTFGVLIAVVLAIGIGMGNLIAYNEYEGEQQLKTDHHHHLHCPAPARVPKTDKTKDVPLTRTFPSSTHIKDQYNNREGVSSDEPTPPQGPYSLHQDTLAYVVKSIDQLSKKLDHFENTTRQLGGIVVLREDPLVQKNPPRKTRVMTEDLKPTFSDQLSPNWETPTDRPVKFSEVVKEDTNALPKDTTADPSKLKDKEIVDFETAADSVGSTERVYQRVKFPKHSKEHGSKYHSNYLATAREQVKVPVGESATKKERMERSSPRESYKRDRSPPRGEFEPDFPKNSEHKIKREKVKRQNNVWENSHVEHPIRSEKFKRANSIPKDYTRERSAPRDYIQRERSVPRENNQRERSVPRDYNQRERSIPRELHQHERPENFKRGKSIQRQEFKGENLIIETNPKREKSPPREHKIPKQPHKHFQTEDNKENQRENPKIPLVSESSPEKSSKKFKKSKNIQASDSQIPAPHNPPDWDSERAKQRESQRIQQNWDNDFRSSKDQKRRRQQNWQIERDHVREKFRNEKL